MADIGIVCERVRKLMNERGVGIYAISDQTGISRASLSLYASLTKPVVDINSKNLILLAEYFGTSCDYLLGVSDSPVGDSGEQRFAEHTCLSAESVENIRVLARSYQSNILDDMFSDSYNEMAELLGALQGYLDLKHTCADEKQKQEQRIRACMALFDLMEKLQ